MAFEICKVILVKRIKKKIKQHQTFVRVIVTIILVSCRFMFTQSKK